MYRHLHTVAIFLLSTILCIGVTSSHAQRFPFYNLNVENGLIQSQSLCLAQDKLGHLWIGTWGGLSRYDGANFTNYSVRDGLLSDRINSIAIDTNATIWLGTAAGLSYFDGKKFHHLLTHAADSAVPNTVNNIKVAADNNIWCLQGGQVYKVHHKVAEKISLPSASRAFVIDVLPYQKGALVSTTFGEVLYYHEGNWEKIPILLSEGQLFVRRFYTDKEQQTWAITNRGLYRLIENKFIPYKLPNNAQLPTIVTMREGNDHSYWLGTQSGAIRIKDTNIQYYNKLNGLCNNTIFDLLSDVESNMWLATDGQGIFRFSGSQFTCFDESSGLTSGQIMSITSDAQNRIYLGTYDAGIFLYDKGKISPLQISPGTKKPLSITTARFRKNDLWVGTNQSGLYRYNGKTSYRYVYPVLPIPSNTVEALYTDMENRLWIGFPGGVVIYENDSFHSLPIYTQFVQDFCSLGKDSILIATENGIKLYHNHNVSSFTTHTIADSNCIQCFARYGDYLWIGTSDNGVVYYNLKTAKGGIINKSNGLRSDFIYNIIADDMGNIWIGTGFGIHKIQLINNRSFVTFYGKGQGVTGMESNLNAICKMPDGTIWFGTTNGTLRCQPMSVIHQPGPISVVLQSVKLFGENITDTSYFEGVDNVYHIPMQLRLPYRKNNLTFTFHGVSLSGAEDIKYRYRIDGLDAPWSDWSDINSVNYSSLPPGKYTLWVQSKGVNEKNIQQLSYSFEIITPFHKQRWFRICIFALCILLGVGLQYFTNKRKLDKMKEIEQLRREEQNKVRERTAEDFHDEVGNKLTRINILSNVLKSKIHPVTPDALRIIEQIQDNTNQIYSGTRDILWSLKPSNDSLYEILLRIHDFGNELFQDTDIEFTFSGTDDKWKGYRLQLDSSRNLIMIFKEALNNSLKYAKAKKVAMTVSWAGTDTFLITLTDDGNGFDLAHTQRGHGIDNMTKRAQRINGTLKITTAPHSGTKIELEFKIPSKRG